MFDNSSFGNYQSAVPYTRPQPYMPQQMRRPQICGDQLIKVNGEAAIKNFVSNMDANSRAVLFDLNDDYFYIVTTDGAGYPTTDTYAFERVVSKAPAPEKEPVYRDEFDSFKNELKEALENVKQLVQSKPARKSAADSGSSADVE